MPDRPTVPSARAVMSILRGMTPMVALVVAVPAFTTCGAPRSDGVIASPIAMLAVPDASNSTASLAAAAGRVAVVWVAVKGDVASVVAAVSADDGKSFAAPVQVNDIPGDVRTGGDQGPRVAIAASGEIAVWWTSKLDGAARIRQARSVDGGRTFQPSTNVTGGELTGARGWVSIARSADDLLHAAWLDGRDATSALPAAPSSPHQHVMRQDIYHAAAHPRGPVTETRVATGVCFCCKTAVTVAADGTTYVGWRHVYPVNLRDIAVAASSDGGRTFGMPVRVSEDHWQINGCPEDGPALAVDTSSVLHVVWPTIVGNADRKSVFYSTSSDRAQTFSPRRQLAPQGSHPQLASRGGRVVAVWEEDGPDGVSRIRVTPLGQSSFGPASSWTVGSTGEASRPALRSPTRPSSSPGPPAWVPRPRFACSISR